MKKTWILIVSVLLILNVLPALGQTSQEDIAAANQQFEQWAKNLAYFVKDVRFNEGDIKSFISLAEEFNSFGAGEDDDEEYTDFNTIVNDSEYMAWARSKGISGEMWLKKSMRIIAVMMRTEMAENSPEDQFDLQDQLEQLEEMRAQIGEEAYQQALQSMTAASAAMQGLENAYKYLPVPTESEKALLAQYKEQLMSLE